MLGGLLLAFPRVDQAHKVVIVLEHLLVTRPLDRVIYVSFAETSVSSLGTHRAVTSVIDILPASILLAYPATFSTFRPILVTVYSLARIDLVIVMLSIASIMECGAAGLPLPVLKVL